MARVLFVRVSVQTYDEKLIKKYWPLLFKTALPEGFYSLKGPEQGVFALIAALRDGVQFSLIDAEQGAILKPFVERLTKLERDLEAILGEQEVQHAKKCIDSIEACLDEAEEALS